VTQSTEIAAETVQRARGNPGETRKRVLVPGKEREATRDAVRAGLPSLSAERPRGDRNWRAKLVRSYGYKISYKEGPLAFEDDGEYIDVTESEARYLATVYDQQMIADGGGHFAQQIPKFDALDPEGNEITRSRRRPREVRATAGDACERHLKRQEIARRRARARDEAELVGAEDL